MKIEFAPGFKNSWDKLFAVRYAPYRAWKAFLRIPREVQWKIQRMNKGWAVSDTWGIYYHLGHVIPEMVRHLRKHLSGHPGYMTNEQWEIILDNIAYGFELSQAWDDDYVKAVGFTKDGHEYYDFSDPVWRAAYEKKAKEVEATFQYSMALLAKYWGHLWD